MDEEKIPENKRCECCEGSFVVTDSDLEFYESISPMINDIKYNIPTPKFCPDCRHQRRLCFVNERKLYKRESSKSGKNIISVYSPDKGFKVFGLDEWWGNDYEGLDYGIEIDFDKVLVSQYDELYKRVPKPPLAIMNSQNSEYNNYLSNSKNTYLSISSGVVEDSAYVTASFTIKKSFDIWWSGFVENSYEIFNSGSLYKSYYSQNCTNSSDLTFCMNCDNCTNCSFCFGIIGKKYHIMNKAYSKKEYEVKIKELDLFNYSRLEEYYQLFRKFMLTKPHKYINSTGSENVEGDYIYESKNCKNSFNIVNVENAKYAYECGRISNIFDCTQVYDGEGMILDSTMISGCYKVLFSFNIDSSNNIYYSSDLVNCSNCFLSSGLRNKNFCILNKEYNEKEYRELVPKIIELMKNTGEWGEFFNIKLSPFGYNETIADESFPLSKQEAKNMGFNWSNYESPLPNVEKIIRANKLPNNISDIPDDILNWAIECEISKKPFRIIKNELEFYRKHNLPIPRKHPDIRHLDRIKLRNKRKLYDRTCDKCSIQLKTVFSLGMKEIVYCEECYNREIY